MQKIAEHYSAPLETVRHCECLTTKDGRNYVWLQEFERLIDVEWVPEPSFPEWATCGH